MHLEGETTMIHQQILRKMGLLLGLLLTPLAVYAQVTQADYERASRMRTSFQGLAVNIVDRPTWIGKTSHFWYRKSVKGGNEFVLVDADTMTKKAAFDHEKLAASLSAAANKKYTAITLPFMNRTFVDNEQAIEFIADLSRWRCSLSDYSCQKLGPAPTGPPFRKQADNPEEEPPMEYGNDVVDGMFDLFVQGQQRNQTQGQQSQAPGRGQEQQQTSKTSPDGKWEAFIQNYNVFIRTKGTTAGSALSFDGSEGNYYTLASINWSPDST